MIANLSKCVIDKLSGLKKKKKKNEAELQFLEWPLEALAKNTKIEFTSMLKRPT